MWAKIQRHAPNFPSAVLNFFEDSGYPASLRVVPNLDPQTKAITFALPPYIQPQTGKAGLLFHHHDEKLAHLKSFLLTGNLQPGAGAWVFHPERFIPGMGMNGVASYWRFITQGRRTAKEYLRKRGLPRPKIGWKTLITWLEEAKHDQ